ncbi:hypothetical protein Pfo_003192 [Paulownia fortunei]|nr:hypothetical protein Pfo_003192 [Paulownia fortunei]
MGGIRVKSSDIIGELDVTNSNLMDYYATNPGPVDDSILYDQDKHVSAAVWEGQVSEVHLDVMNTLQSLTVGCLPRNRLNW